ncbi:MAG: hypothetical protein ACI4VF_01710 [Lachnospirales bacterium]
MTFIADYKSTIIKLIFAVAIAFCLAIPFSVSTHAAPAVNNFKITSGIAANKTSEITFDSTRVISGTAETGAKISITIYEPYTNSAGQTAYKLIRTYNLTVGSTGIFSQNISLKEGVNYLVITARKDGKYSEIRTTINRKNKVLKSVLSQSIAVPGRGKW